MRSKTPRSALPDVEDHELEQEVVEAASLIVKNRQRVKSKQATKNDQMDLLRGETQLKRIFPSLKQRDVHKLAHVIVEVSSWSLLHLLGLRLPDVAQQDQAPKLAQPTPETAIIETEPSAHLYDQQGKEVPFLRTIAGMMGDVWLSCSDIVSKLERYHLTLHSTERGPHGHPLNTVSALRAILLRNPQEFEARKWRSIWQFKVRADQRARSRATSE